MINEKTVFDQPVKIDERTYNNVRKITNIHGDDYTTGCLPDYPYFKRYCQMMAMDLGKQQELDTGPKATEQINFTRNPDRAGNTTMLFILEEVKETILNFSQKTVGVL